MVLQEVGRGWPIAGSMDQAEWLSLRLDMPFSWAPAADDQFGNVVLSRFPIEAVEVRELPYGEGPQHRSALRAVLQMSPDTTVTVIDAHLQNGDKPETREAELGVNLRDYLPAYELARSAGLRCCAHAGEDTGPENIQTAIDALRVERIDHGLSILQDPKLTERVAAERIPLDVCPNSNVLIANKVETLSAHPFRRMREAGLLVTLNTDDPAMTDMDLGTEYRTVAETLGMSVEDMAAVALAGVEAAWLDDSDKRQLRARFQAELDLLLST